MIPRLSTARAADTSPPTFLERVLELGFRGDIEVGESSRIVSSTDNSIYEIKPRGLLFPFDGDDLVVITRVLSEKAFEDIVVAPRGGGTGTNGQSLTAGYVVDCSRHMNRILSIDPVNRVARVEAGVVKDQLNRALKSHGLFFAPELSTSNRATIGGMISTDACGQGSCIYGKTSNHVLGVRIILPEGSDWWSRPLEFEDLEQIKSRQDRVGYIHRTVHDIHLAKRELIDRTFPKLNRYMTGYDLAHIVRDGNKFDLNSIICGSEGTLGFIAEAELNLLPIPAMSALVNIRYDDFNTALEDARFLAGIGVASVETVDEKVLRLAKADIVWPSIAAFFPDDAAGQANGINIVEVLADTSEELESRIAAVTAALDVSAVAGRRGHSVARSSADIEAIWTMRKRAVGLLGNVEGAVRPVAFVEDTAVPPENLAAYIREFRALLDAEGLDYGMFGHVDAGVLHVRPALDLTRPEHEALVRRISDTVVALTRKHGGVLWGEHGKGIRSEYVPEYFGELYPSLQDIKRAFDPRNQLNPGKIASPADAELMRIDEAPLRGQADRSIRVEARSAFDNAAFCNGNGACFDFDTDSAMCPSYKATRDRRYSPKGRAMLIKEWLRLLGQQGVDALQEAQALRKGLAWRWLPRRIWNSLNPANRDDFSHEVRRSLDNCLACKACAGQCPVKVNVPAFRSKFFELYHSRYLRPIKDPLVAMIERTLPWFAHIRPLYNFLVEWRFSRAIIERLGLTALPTMPSLSLWRELDRQGVRNATVQAMLGLAPEERSRAIVFVVDAFTAYFNPQLVLDAVTLGSKLGFTPFVRRSIQNGKALHVHGYLGKFGKLASANTRSLQALSQTGATLVGLDPSMTLAFRSEYRAHAQQDIPEVLLPQEWLLRDVDRLSQAGRRSEHSGARLLMHCTERTNSPQAGRQWQEVFQRAGIALSIPDVGCCGMAGTFGHESRNRALSERIYGQSWAGELSKTSPEECLATGFSCRSQVKITERQSLRHPIQYLNAVLLA